MTEYNKKESDKAIKQLEDELQTLTQRYEHLQIVNRWMINFLFEIGWRSGIIHPQYNEQNEAINQDRDTFIQIAKELLDERIKNLTDRTG